MHKINESKHPFFLSGDSEITKFLTLAVKIAKSVNNAHWTWWFIKSKYPTGVKWLKAKL